MKGEDIHPLPGIARLLKAVFQGSRDGVGPVGGLVHTQEKVACRRWIAYHEVGIERTGNANGIGRSAASENPSGASGDQGGRWRRTHAAHILGHGRSLVVLVIPLLVAVLNLRREVFPELVFKDYRDFVDAVDRLRVVGSGISASQRKLVRSGENRGIS